VVRGWVEWEGPRGRTIDDWNGCGHVCFESGDYERRWWSWKTMGRGPMWALASWSAWRWVVGMMRGERSIVALGRRR
jgi:hypothetical protein